MCRQVLPRQKHFLVKMPVKEERGQIESLRPDVLRPIRVNLTKS